ncbi:S41 family peptidase [Sphingobacterium hungaricum]
MKLTYFPIVFAAIMLFVSGCKKDSVERQTYEDDPKENLLKDSVFYWTKVYSLWETSLPPKDIDDLLIQSTLRDYTKYFETAEDVLESLKALTPNDPSTGNPIDRFSFIDREGVVSGEIQDAVATSYGMYLFYLNRSTDNNADLYVRMVDAGSPAANAGIKRGTRIKSINGNSAIDYNTQAGQNFKFVNDALNSSSMTLVISNQGESDKTVSIQSTLYSFNPILSAKVITQGTKKVGYLAFSSFVDVYSSGIPNQMYTRFENIFASFQSEGINELIIDLRYNGGGSTNTAEYLADRIAPTATNGQPMYTYKVNKLLQDEGLTAEGEAFGPVKFNKIGSINLPKVYFLVTSSTASASELLMNVLEPYMNVQLIGTFGNGGVKENTYGKPVGFFGFEPVLGNSEIELYATSFQMFNSKGFGDYFGGLVPDQNTYEDFLKDFGDPEEGLIAEALYHIQNNRYYNTNSATSKIASKDRLNSNKVIGLKAIGENASSKGMFKFDNKKVRIR